MDRENQERLSAMACERVRLIEEIDRRVEEHVKPLKAQLRELDESMAALVAEAESGQQPLPMGGEQ